MRRARRPLALGLAVALVVIAAAVTVLLVTRASGPQPPAVGSERMVPAAVLAYLHVSTDPEREVDAQADTLLSRLPGLRSGFDNLVAGVVSIGPGLSYRRDVRPWLGEQVAVALLDTPNTTATPLAVLAVADRTGADAFLARAGTPPQVSDHRGARIATYGTLSTAFAGRFLLVGPLSAVRAGLDVSAGRSPALGRDALFARTTRGLPSDRVADAYLPADGVRRLLAAQPGVLGAAGALIVRGDLRASALSMSATQDGARLRVRSVLDPAAGTAPVAAFEPRLTEAGPAARWPTWAPQGWTARSVGCWPRWPGARPPRWGRWPNAPGPAPGGRGSTWVASCARWPPARWRCGCVPLPPSPC